MSVYEETGVNEKFLQLSFLILDHLVIYQVSSGSCDQQTSCRTEFCTSLGAQPGITFILDESAEHDLHPETTFSATAVTTMFPLTHS